MQISTADIERVVREVLASMTVAPKSQEVKKTETVAAPAAAKTNPSSDNHHQSSTITLTNRVVTMNDVAGHLATMRRLIVSRRAIVTPAVVDMLIRRGIALDRQETKADRTVKMRLSLISMGLEFDAAALTAVLAREGFCIEDARSDCLIAATDQLAEEVKLPETLGVVLTPHVAAGLCLANRHAGVRAASDLAAVSAVGANVLILDPRELSFFRLKQILGDFARGGVRPCPKSLSEKLG